MKQDRYQLKASQTLTVFEFMSEGPKGKIRKIVQYSETNLKDFYNLGFGDSDGKSNEIDDMIITNNGDSQKVLATVAATVYAFTDKILMPGFMQQEVAPRVQGYIALELQITLKK